ncbi:L-threonylcarbamoyladenylate synthase [Psychrobacter sp. T6-1]|uniref:L-threonylcarbamoyladenylate synthase n=1 Tax=Psychrobacter sp. T6-1 TaxID=3457447 RepID=UPI003FD52339
MSLSSPLITESVVQAATWLKQGRLLAYPTESVWGIGCDAYDKAAVGHILDIKQRPQAKGMIVITDSSERLTPLLETLDKDRHQQIMDSWQVDNENLEVQHQQAHTWLLPIPQTLVGTIPLWITGQHQSIAVRVIAHPLIRELCRQLVSIDNPYGFIVSTSCNPSGQPPAKNFSEAYNYFNTQISYLQADTLGYTQPSQIRDAVTGLVVR